MCKQQLLLMLFFHISSRYRSSSLRRESEAHSWTPDLVKVWGSSLRWLLRHRLVFVFINLFK